MVGWNDFLISLISGGAAGLTADICLYPLDTIKTRMQAKQGFIKSGGFHGIYKGIGAVFLGSIPGGALFFAAYDTSKATIRSLDLGIPAPLIQMISASIGEVIGCLIRVPTEVIKQRMQAGLHHSLTEAVSTAYKLNGFSGFYVGYGTTIMREIPFSLIQFPIYEKLKLEIAKFRDGQAPTSYEAALCGSISGAFAAGVTTPLDVLKTRRMLTLSTSSSSPNPGTIASLRLLYKEGGFRTLFAGVEPRVMWIGIGGFFFFGAFEKVKSLLTNS